MKTLTKIALALAAGYVVDVPVRRALAARAARAYANARGKPLLNVGAGMPTNFTQEQAKKLGNSALYPGTLYGDVNVDITGDKGPSHGMPGIVTYADVTDLPFDDGAFGAVLCSHVLEHVENPELARRELLRVVGGDEKALFVVTPGWWSPLTVLAPTHLWYFTDGAGGTRGGRALRLQAPQLPRST